MSDALYIVLLILYVCNVFMYHHHSSLGRVVGYERTLQSPASTIGYLSRGGRKWTATPSLLRFRLSIHIFQSLPRLLVRSKFYCALQQLLGEVSVYRDVSIQLPFLYSLQDELLVSAMSFTH